MHFLCSYDRYNITTGKYPFEGDNIYRLLENIGKNQWIVPDWFCKTDANLATLVVGMLQFDPKSRFTLEQAKCHTYVFVHIFRPPKISFGIVAK